MEGPKPENNNKLGQYSLDKPVETESSNEGDTGHYKVRRSGNLDRQISGSSVDTGYSSASDDSSDVGERDVESVPKAKSKLRIKPQLERQLSDAIKDLLKDKMELGFKDERFVESLPEIDESDVDSVIDYSEEYGMQSGKEVEGGSSRSLLIESEQKAASVSDPVVKVVTVHDKKNIQQMVDQLAKKTKVLLPKYSAHIDIVIRSALKNFESGGGSEDVENLYEALHRFSMKLSREMATNKDLCEGQEYWALINAYGVLGDLVEDDFNKRMVVECKERLRKVFGCYQNPSEESFLRARVQLGLDVNVVSVDGGYEVSTQIVGCDDTKIRVFLNQKLTLRATFTSNPSWTLALKKDSSLGF